jgi:hypothetical protein
MLPVRGCRRLSLSKVGQHSGRRCRELVGAATKSHDFSKLSDSELAQQLEFVLDTGEGPTEYLGRPCGPCLLLQSEQNVLLSLPLSCSTISNQAVLRCLAVRR